MEYFIAGIPVGAPGYTPGPGYIEVTCGCGRKIWIGPKQAALREHCKLVCPHCMDGSYAMLPPLNPNSGSKIDMAELEKAYPPKKKE